MTGEVVADAVQEGVQAFLGSMHRAPPPQRSSSGRHDAEPFWDEPRTPTWTDTSDLADSPDDPFWLDDIPEPPRSQPQPERPRASAPVRESPWIRATAAGCTAAAWWLRRRSGRGVLLAALGVGLVATLAAFACGPRLSEGLSVAASAFDLLSLTNPARSGAALLSGA